ncbi:unnamed protein product [Cuscuta europaea]|uniref:Uncharacterized protein n=1 Tax=Cuscuta europaea TaxID=41803 RepID=A0A9P1EB22_CUSEU|nr:unnamed protein product [Cuscuta europaea]
MSSTPEFGHCEDPNEMEGIHRASPFEDVKMEEIHIRAPPFESIKMEGTNIGASMVTSESRYSGCINIYINNNIQGVNHSILLGSRVDLRDPGIRFSINGLTFQLEPQQHKTRGNFVWLASSLLLFSLFVITFLLHLVQKLKFSSGGV